MVNEIGKILKDGHIKPVEEACDETFIQPVVVTVKKEKCFNIAQYARSLNNAFQKNKYQMPNLENLMEQDAEIINAKEEGTVMSTSLDMLFAHGQNDLHP